MYALAMFTFASQFNFRHFMIPSLPRLFRADPVAAAQAPPSPQRAKRQRAGDPDSATACGSMEARCARDSRPVLLPSCRFAAPDADGFRKL